VLFIVSGLMLSASFATYDICSASNYYFSSQSNFNSLPFANNQVGQILSKCYFTANSTIFSAINTTATQNLGNIQNFYLKSMPSSTFSCVVSTI
jgi:hypothetical protein